MKELTREQLRSLIEKLEIENKELIQQNESLKNSNNTLHKYSCDQDKRQEMIRRMLITSEIVTEEQFELLDKIVAPLDQ